MTVAATIAPTCSKVSSRHRYDADPGWARAARSDEVSQSKTGRDPAGDRTPNTPGLWSVMFTVESVDDTVARLRADGAELIGEVVQYEDMYRLCYMRGPAGIIVSLAEELF